MSDPSSRIYRDIPRLAPGALLALRGVAVADFHEALAAEAGGGALLDARIVPRTPGLAALGQAVTAAPAPGDSLLVHVALSLAGPGDILVIADAETAQGALWGGNLAYDARATGLAGAIVDAPVRDLAACRALKFPLWARSVSVESTTKQGGGAVNMPVQCGGRMIAPGDIIAADDDGVIAFAPRHLAAVIAGLAKRAERDAKLRARMNQGERLFDTQHFGALLAAKAIVIHEGCWREED